MSIPKRNLLMNSFFTSQFNYCPLTWMCHSRTMNNKINCLLERCLHIIYSDKTSFFEKFSEKDGSVTMFKVYKNLSPAIIADLFHVRQNNYNLRHDSYFAVPNVKSVYHRMENLSNLGPRIWNLVPDKLKQIYEKLIYHMLVLFKVSSLYLFLKHIQEQSTRNSLMKGLFYGRTL